MPQQLVSKLGLQWQMKKIRVEGLMAQTLGFEKCRSKTKCTRKIFVFLSVKGLKIEGDVANGRS